MATSVANKKLLSKRGRSSQLRDYRYPVAVCSLRLLLGTGLLPILRRGRMRHQSEQLALATGIPAFADIDGTADCQLLALARFQLRELLASPSAPGLFEANLAALATELHLTNTEKDVLGFLTLTGVSYSLEVLISGLGENATFTDGCRWIATALGRRYEQVARCLRSGGTLRSSGLVAISTEPSDCFIRRFKVLRGLSHALVTPRTSVNDFFTEHFMPAQQAATTLDDFRHAKTDADMVRDYLAKALARRTRGVNVLLYGEPGIGKTQFVRAIAAALATPLYEVPVTARDGDCLADNNRLQSYQLAQSILSRNPQSLLVFEEADSALGSGNQPGLGFREAHNYRTKAWVNQLIESNPVPAVWIANGIGELEDAVIRRFDIVLKLPAPTRAVRKQILHNYLDGIDITERWLDAHAADRHLLPGHIERAAKVVRALGCESAVAAEATLGHIVDSTLRAMGHRRQPLMVRDAPDYQLDYLQADYDLQQLIQGLQTRPCGRLCLYGPPGTGKTAFGHYLGSVLGLPLISRRASDLLSPFVGGTEQKIAQAFDEARAEGGMLLIDEVDSFLASRATASQNWERTQVNEMLTQLESFDGVLLAATNLMDNLDEAALRRFDLKIRFGYLKPEQQWRLFHAMLGSYGITLGKTDAYELRSHLDLLTTCTPGDFAAVSRRRKLLGAPATASELLKEIAAEQTLKADCPKPGIGFLAASRSQVS